MDLSLHSEKCLTSKWLLNQVTSKQNEALRQKKKKRKQSIFLLLSSLFSLLEIVIQHQYMKSYLSIKNYQFKSNCKFLNHFPVKRSPGHVIALAVDWLLSGQGRMSWLMQKLGTCWLRPKSISKRIIHRTAIDTGSQKNPQLWSPIFTLNAFYGYFMKNYWKAFCRAALHLLCMCFKFYLWMYRGSIPPDTLFLVYYCMD